MYIVAYNLNNIATLNHVHLFIADLFFPDNYIYINCGELKFYTVEKYKNFRYFPNILVIFYHIFKLCYFYF